MPVVIIPLTLLWRSPPWPGPGAQRPQPRGGRRRDRRHARRPARGDERRTLEERVVETDLVEQHAELGEAARTFAILVFLIAVAYAVREWRGGIPARHRPRAGADGAAVIGIALSVALIASFALTTVSVVRAGHAGAERDLERPARRGAGSGDGDSDAIPRARQPGPRIRRAGAQRPAGGIRPVADTLRHGWLSDRLLRRRRGDRRLRGGDGPAASGGRVVADPASGTPPPAARAGPSSSSSPRPRRSLR